MYTLAARFEQTYETDPFHLLISLGNNDWFMILADPCLLKPVRTFHAAAGG
jgi:hypothetical protein